MPGFILLFAVQSAAVAAVIGPDCTEQSQAKWLDREMISRRAAEAGYKTIVILDVQGTCYHVRALTRSNLQADVYLDPVTGDVVSAVLFDE
ncbi:PepSY domain-containing protein [Rhizobium sp. DKSPLA3]|uniref:PepSY domain-containing protein n=1 Tax=Rhizobium quercicola TaxID=2901226 RepID=A0A9X1NW77_9HYPH|nr:PepSY domain-containing protein [Rhizobium quercicola]MCD7111500.1 PepSY domain-containing protein [Rhizobium quercicola]